MNATNNSRSVTADQTVEMEDLSQTILPAGIACESQVWGVYSDEVTPDPISNSEVKLVHGKTSTEEARRKASSMPHLIR